MTNAVRVWVHVAIGLSLGLLPVARGQTLPRQAPRVPAQVGGLAQRLETALAGLNRDIDSTLTQTAAGKLLGQDARELALTVAEFRANLPKYGTTFQAKRAYTAIDGPWRCDLRTPS